VLLQGQWRRHVKGCPTLHVLCQPTEAKKWGPSHRGAPWGKEGAEGFSLCAAAEVQACARGWLRPQLGKRSQQHPDMRVIVLEGADITLKPIKEKRHYSRTRGSQARRRWNLGIAEQGMKGSFYCWRETQVGRKTARSN